MALNLTLSFEEQNDAKAIIVRDTTGTEDSTAWDVGLNPNFTEVDNVNYALYLTITITTPDNDPITYDTIDLYDEFGPFVNYEDLTYTINASHLITNGEALGDADDDIPDGVWDITYTVSEIGVATQDFTFTVFFSGVIQKEVYDKLRVIPTTYLCSDCNSRNIREAMFMYAYLVSLKSAAYLGKTEELLTQLAVLERMVINGTNNTW
jgi:hypothetical protein